MYIQGETARNQIAWLKWSIEYGQDTPSSLDHNVIKIEYAIQIISDHSQENQ